MMWCVSMKVISESKVFWKAARSLSGAGWMVASSASTSVRSLGGVDFLGDAGELGLIFVQVGEGDLEQAVERDVHHLVVGELLAEGVGAEPEVAVRAGQQVGLHPCAVGLERRNDGGIGFCEVGFGAGVGHAGEGAGNIVLEEADEAVDLFERDLGEDVRRVLEVLARFVKRLRDQLFARDHGAQADVGGGVGPLHEDEDRVGDRRRNSCPDSSPRGG